VRVIVERSQRKVRHWAYDIAKYLHLDPVQILCSWSVGDVVEALHAIETYEAIQDAQQSAAEKQNESKARSPWH
jgi:hypothetical protein